jgi:hypothetical protein
MLARPPTNLPGKPVKPPVIKKITHTCPTCKRNYDELDISNMGCPYCNTDKTENQFQIQNQRQKKKK